VERYVYDPYGKVTIYDDDWSDTVAWADSKKNDILYSGYRYDHESRLYHVRFRMYHPTLGRWMQRDRIGYADGMGLYEYVGSLPGRYLDPSGRAALPTPGAPLGNHRLGVIPDRERKNPGFADDIADTMREMCPCFSYETGPAGSNVIITITGNPDYEEKIKFCCCYYEHLPACNLFYRFATEGLASSSYPGGIVPVRYGAQLPKGGGLRMQKSKHTIAEEMAHGVYGAPREYVANPAADLVAGTGRTEDRQRSGKNRDRQPRNIVDTLDKVLNDLVSDHFGCQSMLPREGAEAEEARKAAERFRDRASKMRGNVEWIPPKTEKEEKQWQQHGWHDERPRMPPPYWP